jgi:hypothetical protein
MQRTTFIHPEGILAGAAMAASTAPMRATCDNHKAAK